MRKALFAVMLIGASFAGGAVVNGPGLRWAQEMILSHLNGDGDEGGDQEDKSKSDESEPPAQLLSAPLSLDEALAAGKAGAPDGKTEPEAASQDGQTQPRPAGSESGPAEAKIAAAAAAALAAGRNGAANAPAAAPAAKSEGSVAAGALKMLGNAFGRKEEPPADDHEIALAKVPTPLPEGTVPPPLEPLDPLPLPNEPGDAASRPAAKVDDPPAKDRDKRLALAAAPIAAAAAAAAATAAGSPPPQTVEPTPAPEKGAGGTGAGADANATPRPASSWTEIRSRMAKLGVSRYGVEGEPNGRVRFHCVIPLAGRRAVAQQFEAEGDDELQAAEIALRRVALWRATENPGP